MYWFVVVGAVLEATISNVIYPRGEEKSSLFMK